MDIVPIAVRTGRRRDDRGASLVEYVMLMALIAIVCVAAVTFLGDSASGSITDSGESIVNAG